MLSPSITQVSWASYSRGILTDRWCWVLTFWRAGLCLGKILIWLWTQEIFKEQVCWWVRLCPIQFVAWPGGILTLEPKCSEWGQVLVPRCQFQREFTLMNTTQYVSLQCLCPNSEIQSPLLYRRPPKPPDRSGSGSYQITVFALSPSACEILCAFFKSEVLISPNPMEPL